MSTSPKTQNKPVNAKKPWTEGEEKNAVRWFTQKAKIKEIAEDLGRYPLEVINMLKKSFTAMKKENSWTNEQLLKETGYDLSRKSKKTVQTESPKPQDKKPQGKKTKTVTGKPNIGLLRSLQNQVNSLVAQAASISTALKRMEESQKPKPGGKKSN